jgi:predicted ester cyclase
MTTADRLVRELVSRVWNEGRFDDLDRYFAPSIDHGGQTQTVAEMREWLLAEHKVWTNNRYEILTLVSDSHQVAIHWRATARHSGPWGSVVASGKTITWDGAHFFDVHEGRITSMWAIGDRLAKALQLGVRMTPPTEAPP